MPALFNTSQVTSKYFWFYYKTFYAKAVESFLKLLLKNLKKEINKNNAWKMLIKTSRLVTAFLYSPEKFVSITMLGFVVLCTNETFVPSIYKLFRISKYYIYIYIYHFINIAL